MAIRLKSEVAYTRRSRNIIDTPPKQLALFSDIDEYRLVFDTVSSGNKSNCVVFRYGKYNVQIDFGVSLEHFRRYFGKRFVPSLALVSHKHSSHFEEAIYRDYKNANWVKPIYYEPKPRSYGDKFVRSYPFLIRQVRLKHDFRFTCGFVIEVGVFKVGYFTDLGRVTENVYRACSNLTHLIIEANHDEQLLHRKNASPNIIKRFQSEEGHLSNQQCAEALSRIIPNNPKLKSIVICHLHEKYNRASLASVTIQNILYEKRISHPEFQIVQPNVPMKIEFTFPKGDSLDIW